MIEYRDIKGYEGKYQVSNTGIVIALNFHNQKFKKVLHQDFDKFTDGYKRVSLYLNGKKKRYSVHRLVANAFIPNPLNKPCVNHKDSNRTNNNVDNLELLNMEFLERNFQKRLKWLKQVLFIQAYLNVLGY